MVWGLRHRVVEVVQTFFVLLSAFFGSADEGAAAMGRGGGDGGGIAVASRSRLTTPRLRHRNDSGASVFTGLVFTGAVAGTRAMSVLPIGVSWKFEGTVPHETIQ